MTVWRIAGVLGALGVLLGAFGAHGLKNVVTDTHLLDVWDTAARYHMLHAVAVAACAGHTRPQIPVVLFTLGTAVFAGSLYAMTLTAVPTFGAITPIGGVLLIAGWVALAVQARA